ncbi:unnamed protein product [Ilex paraguariensis]|uniref:Uncharacterized protein n=1 Tax=Ilex paraguariensis TaxID=185542 RepID=A0ABC8SKT7_9AQUA
MGVVQQTQQVANDGGIDNGGIFVDERLNLNEAQEVNQGDQIPQVVDEDREGEAEVMEHNDIGGAWIRIEGEDVEIDLANLVNVTTPDASGSMESLGIAAAPSSVGFYRHYNLPSWILPARFLSIIFALSPLCFFSWALYLAHKDTAAVQSNSGFIIQADSSESYEMNSSQF